VTFKVVHLLQASSNASFSYSRTAVDKIGQRESRGPYTTAAIPVSCTFSIMSYGMRSSSYGSRLLQWREYAVFPRREVPASISTRPVFDPDLYPKPGLY